MSLVLCDDHRMFVDALAMALRARDHDVAATCSDLQALPGVLRQARPDLCVLGVQYGGRARPEVVETVRASVPGISVLVLTGWPTENVWRLYESAHSRRAGLQVGRHPDGRSRGAARARRRAPRRGLRTTGAGRLTGGRTTSR